MSVVTGSVASEMSTWKRWRHRQFDNCHRYVESTCRQQSLQAPPGFTPGASLMSFIEKVAGPEALVLAGTFDCAEARSAFNVAAPADASIASNSLRLTLRIVFVVTMGKPQCFQCTRSVTVFHSSAVRSYLVIAVEQTEPKRLKRCHDSTTKPQRITTLSTTGIKQPNGSYDSFLCRLII